MGETTLADDGMVVHIRQPAQDPVIQPGLLLQGRRLAKRRANQERLGVAMEADVGREHGRWRSRGIAAQIASGMTPKRKSNVTNRDHSESCATMRPLPHSSHRFRRRIWQLRPLCPRRPERRQSALFDRQERGPSCTQTGYRACARWTVKNGT